MYAQYFKMAPLCLILALLIQSSFTYANSNKIHDIDAREILKNKPEFDDNVVKGFDSAKKDWIDMLLGSNGLYPSSSAALMAQATSSDKCPEEQLEDIKKIANTITEAIQSEMANLLSYAIAQCEKTKDHGNRNKRSVETPMDSSQLVMRLLKHIKSNNEFQNIAIDKMMTAQEIADKYGIKYTPDEDVLADLASFATHQSEQLSTILGDSYNYGNEQIEFVPLKNGKENRESPIENSTYYVYALHVPEDEIHAELTAYPPHEYMPEQVQYMSPVNNPVYYGPPHPHQNYQNFPETQIPAPPVHRMAPPAHHMPPPVCQRSPFYEPGFTPAQEYYPPRGFMEPVTTTTTIVLPFEEPVAPEPELEGQVYEETVSNKVFVEKGEEPGSTDVSHVMTYTISEKSHFVTPEIEKLPQQVQYYFFLN